MPLSLRVDFDAQMVRLAAKRSKDGPQARRLLALAAIYEGASRSEAAKIGGVTLQIIRDWVLKFNARGPDGLVDRKPPGQAPRLNDTHRGHRQLNQAWTICWQWRGMKQVRDPLYRRYRFPAEVISYAVWLYFRFPLSLRMVEEMLAARGIDVSHESVRHWAEKFGREYSNRIRRRAPARGDKWHMDEVVITIRGKKHWLWRAVDQQGFVLDVLVQNRRDRTAAQRLMRKLLKKSAKAPRVMITDKLKSYGAARKDMGLGIEHRQHKGLNNRAENSHLPTRRRERIMKRFKSPRQVTLLHGGCEARVGAGERSITRHGRRWLVRDRAYD